MAREQRGASTENLLEETDGYVNSVFYDGMATTVTAAHHLIWRHLYASMQAAQTPASKLRFVTPDKVSSMSTLWQKEEFKQICSRELLTEKAADTYLILIAFITGNSSLEPLIEGLCAQIHVNLR